MIQYVLVPSLKFEVPMIFKIYFQGLVQMKYMMDTYSWSQSCCTFKTKSEQYIHHRTTVLAKGVTLNSTWQAINTLPVSSNKSINTNIYFCKSMMTPFHSYRFHSAVRHCYTKWLRSLRAHTAHTAPFQTSFSPQASDPISVRSSFHSISREIESVGKIPVWDRCAW